MPISRENRRLAMDILNGMPIRDASAKHGKSRARAWQVTLAFCLEYMFPEERLDSTGNLKDLKGLRYSWRNWRTLLS